MSGRRRLLLQSPDASWPYMSLVAEALPVHARYADACDADYQCFVGLRDLTAAGRGIWNRIPLILDAFANGYEKVVYLDVDMLIIDQRVDIFDATDDAAPVQMCSIRGAPEQLGGTEERKWSVWEDGAMVVNDTPAAIEMLSFVWNHRHEPPREHHEPEFYDQNWLFDWLNEYPQACVPLDARFNCCPGSLWGPSPDAAVILAWHGIGNAEKWAGFRAAMLKYYARELPEWDALLTDLRSR